MSRQEFPAKVKEQALERSGGFCEGCGLPLQRGRMTFDHRIPDWIGGPNSLENCQVLGWCCDKPKTAKDQGTIAKVKRIRRRENGIQKPRSITRWRNMRGQPVIAPRER